MQALDTPHQARTLPQLIRATAAAYGDDPALSLKRDDGERRVSFAELDRESARIARGLLARGIGKGSRIGFIFGNGPDFALMLAAIGRIGAVAIPISTLIRANELVRVLRQSDVAGVIVHRHFLGHDYVARFCEALPELRTATTKNLRIAAVPYLRWIVSDGDELPASFHDHRYFDDDSVSDAMLRAVEAEVHPADQVIEIYTSGSMALPKGVKHNHGAVLARAHYLRGMLQATRGKEVTAQLPMFWIGGLMMFLITDWVAGAVTICSDRTMNNSRFSVGSVLAEDDLKLVVSKPYWGLGMTETLGPYSYGDVHRAPGRPVCAPLDHWAEGFEVRVVDEHGAAVGDGGIGEIQVRSPYLTPALHKLDREAFFTTDGFLRTGDMAQVEGTRVHFAGRNGDIIKSASSNVSPAEVEMELQALDGVHNAYVVGIPDPERGQLVVAAVVARDERGALDFTVIEAQLRERLSSYKVPRAYIQIRRDEVPMLPSNKVARREVAALIAQRLGRGD
ncbi:class I adenylate-forming enzyme family protein [Solimonas terrae]|uniref:Acyl--CoA ligase n=1 Tax=Solimonas terrae TaxID=1396819 RepID=A0A6M2BU32_9GAMM|nr:class I adenylate-forming enzyme family protein [Solimonas terrae]NGY05755.1 acyl--CoA ligase [Solimonas terrae]